MTHYNGLPQNEFPGFRAFNEKNDAAAQHRIHGRATEKTETVNSRFLSGIALLET
jgi:hypothetical protein